MRLTRMKKTKMNKHIQIMNLLRKIISTLVKHKIIPGVLLFVLFGSTQLAGQQGTLNRDHNEQVTIIGTYDPTINAAYKINLKPEIPEVITQKPDFTFRSLDIKQPTTVEPGQIQPARLRATKKIQVYNNYLKAGFGSWLSPYLNFYHSSGKKNNNRLNFLFNHVSSFKDIPDYSPSPFSNTKVSIGYDKKLGKSILSAGATYGLDTYRYYGFIPTDYPLDSITDKYLKQMFNLVRANVGLRSNNKKSDSFEYDINLATYYYFDKWKTSNFDLGLDFDIAKPFEAGKSGNYQKAGIRGEIKFGINKDSVNTSNDIILTGIPYYNARFGIINVNVGLNFSYLMADSSVFHFYPIVDVAVNIVPEALTIYAGVDGGMVKNSFYSLTQINPWSSSIIPVKWQNNKVKVYAGLRGNIARQLGFNFEVSWLNFENMPFFVNVSDNPVWGRAVPLNKFTAVFDNGKVFTISGELNYAIGEELKIWLGGAYNIYTLDSLTKPYHKPISKINFGASYLIKKKVNVWAEFIASGKRFAQGNFTALGATEIELDGFFDINAGVDVYITDSFSVFVKGTNLLNKNYQLFYNYPVQGLQVIGGIGFRF